MSIAIVTLCVGKDYTKAVEPGLASKREYAKMHGYALHIGGEEVWDRTRPIPWSKLRYIQQYLPHYDYVFWSDADVLITNPQTTLETQVLPYLKEGKDMVWTLDACNNHNNGNLLFRGRSPWAHDFLERCYQQTDLIHHIWWDNAAMVRLFWSNPKDMEKIETCVEHWKFNTFLFGKNNRADDSERLYQRGDFLLHLAGVYDPWNLYRMMKYVQLQTQNQRPLDTQMLNEWRQNPPKNKEVADKSIPFPPVE